MESLSRPLQRNHANFSRKLSNANVLSPKTAYDDVFSGPPKLGPPTFSSRLEDYREIFGSSQAARASSIPVLDLSDLDETNVSSDFRNSTPDYSSIFVGFRDEYIGMSYDELLAAPKGAHNSSAKTSTPSATKFPHQHSDRSSSLEQNQSYDAVKQYNMSYHKTSQEIKDETKVTTHVAELRAVPGFTCFIDETAPLNKTQDDTRKPPAINDVRQKMDFSATSPPPKKQTRGFVRSRNGSSWDGTYSNSKLFANANANEIHLKSHPSNSNLEKSNSPSNSNLEKSNSSFKTSTKMTSDKEVPRTDARDRSPNSSDEELDANSAAAASVAALKKAIEKAQESIRIAKELMEKKEGSQVFSKKSSRSRSKVKDRKENSIAPRRIEENSKEMFENTRVVLRAKDLDTAEKCEPATGFFEMVNNGKHRRAISAFEQVDRNEFQEMKTSGETLERQEGIAAEKATEVVVEASELKEDMEREENVFKVSQDPEKNSDKFESTFIVHEVEKIEGPGAKEVEQIEKKQESCEEVKIEEEFFESQDWDDDKDEEGGVVDRYLELMENEHRQEVPEQQIVEETTKEAVVEEDGEQVLAKRLEEAFNLAENEIRIREVFDSHSNEPKQIETSGHQEREMAKEDIQKDKDVKMEEYERTEIDGKIGSDACDWKENGEENISVGEREAEKSIERESDKSEENEEIEVDEKRSSDGSNDDEESENDVKQKREENEEIQVPEDFNRVSDASNSSSTSETLEEEACQQLDINDEIVKASSPRVSDIDRDEKDSSKALHDDGNSENTDSDIGENQIEQNTEDSESASDFENGIDILVDDTEKNKESSNEAREDTGKEEESNSNKSLETEEEEEKDKERVIEELAKKREKERERMVVERAIREARERAFAEARERAERAAVEKVNAQIRQRVMAEARDKLEKSSSSSSSSYQKDAKLKAERAAVERATSEARKRALEKALSQKTTTSQATPQPVNDKFPGASGDTSRFDGTNSESHQRSKAKLEKHQRIMQRAAKALAEKNMRDILAQKEQAERNRLSESLDADIKRWSNGKEGNLRALLSTLQYVLGTGSGWQPVSLTEIVTTSAVKKAYRKATLYVHPDKLQQRGASIQQKYIREKVFDLLKAAWNKFNAEER